MTEPVLQNLSSSSGTFLNGGRLDMNQDSEGIPLANGDLIKLGSCK